MPCRVSFLLRQQPCRGIEACYALAPPAAAQIRFLVKNIGDRASLCLTTVPRQRRCQKPGEGADSFWPILPRMKTGSSPAPPAERFAILFVSNLCRVYDSYLFDKTRGLCNGVILTNGCLIDKVALFALRPRNAAAQHPLPGAQPPIHSRGPFLRRATDSATGRRDTRQPGNK